MSEDTEKISDKKERASRLQSGTLWIVGAVVAGCALLGASIMDDGWQKESAEPAAHVAEPVVPSSPAPAELPAAETISLHEGQQWTVILTSHAGTGYVWQLAEELPAGSPVSVSLSGVEHDESNCCGFPVPVTLTVTAVKPGTAVVHLVYVRPWENDKAPAEQVLYSVSVAGAASGK